MPADCGSTSQRSRKGSHPDLLLQVSTTTRTPSECTSFKLTDTPKPKKRAPKQPVRKEVLGDVLKDRTILETIYNSEQKTSCFFAVAELGQPPRIVDQYTIRGETVFPMESQAEAFRQGFVAMPSAIGPACTTAELLEDLKRLLAKYIDLEPFYISLIAHYILITWVWTAFGSYGFLRLKGFPGVGKTRVLEVVKRLAYRGTHVGVNPTKSALFRKAHDIQGTLCLDEVDRAEDDLQSGFVQLMNASYRRDGVVMVSENREDTWTPVTYKVGGPKVLSTRLAFGDRALESRCITIGMVVKPIARHIAPYLPDGYEQEAEAMRNRLLTWRFSNLHGINLDASALQHLEPRAREIGLSLYAVSPDEVFRAELLRYLERRSEEEAGEDPVRLVLGVISKIVDDNKRWKLTLKEVHATSARIAAERELHMREFSNREIAELCRNLRFPTKREAAGYVIHINKAVLQEQRERYKLSDDSQA